MIAPTACEWMGAVVTKEPDYPGLYTVTLRGIEKKQDNSYGEFYVKTHLISPRQKVGGRL